MTDRKSGSRGVILAAGLGKRMKSDLPKLLHPLLGKPIIGRVLTVFDSLNLEHLHIIVGHGAKEIMDYVNQQNWKTPISFHVQEPQLGTGDALMQAEAALSNFEGDLIVSAGDVPLLTTASLENLRQQHTSDDADLSLLTTVVPDAKNYGRIVRSPGDNRIVSIVEDKDASADQKQIKEINPSIYCFRWPLVKEGLHQLKNDNRQKEYYLTDLIEWGVKNQYRIGDYLCVDWQEVSGINSRLDLSQVALILRDRVVQKLALESGVTVTDPQSTWIAPEVKIDQDTQILPGCWLMGHISIGQSCTIGPQTSIAGEVFIGSNTNVVQSNLKDCQIGNDCQIGPFAHLRPGSVISDGVRIGNFVEIKQSFIGLNSKVSHLSYVGDTTIGSEANLGAGTIVANYNHISKAKARTTIGDMAATGSNLVLVSPVNIGAGAFVAAGTVITEDVPAGALAVGRTKQKNAHGWADRKRATAQMQENEPR